MGYSEKVSLFLNGLYSLRSQPLATSGWSLQDWIRYVDWFGQWHTLSGEVGEGTPHRVNARAQDRLCHGIRLRLRVVC
jgi:hypothetical protein